MPYGPAWSYGASAGYPPYAHYAPAFQPRPESTVDGGAIGSLLTSLLGLVTLVFCLGVTGFILGPIAFGLGISSLHRIEASEGKLRGRGLGVAGMILGGIAGVGGFVFFLLTIAFVSYTLSHPAPQPS